MKQFTNLFPLSKTLRFELRPQGDTLKYFQQSGILEEDTERKEDYKLVKELIDRYHKSFITEALSGCRLQVESTNKGDSIEEYYALYALTSRDEKQAKAFESIQTNLRKQIASSYKSGEKGKFERIFKKDLIKKDLIDFLENEAEKELVRKFKGHTTYFTGFHENRKNIYSDKAISTSITYRLIHQNLPKFIDNIRSFKKIAESEVATHFAEIVASYSGILQIESLEQVFTLAYFNQTLSQPQITAYNTLLGGHSEDDCKIQGLNEYINLYNQRQERSKRLPLLKPLFKQILSDRESISWIPEAFECDQELLDSVHEAYKRITATTHNSNMPLSKLLSTICLYDLDQIYIANDTSLSNISQKVTGDWSTISKAIERTYTLIFPQKKKETEANYQKRKEEYIEKLPAFSIQFIDNCLRNSDTHYEIASYYAAVNSEPLCNTVITSYDAATELFTTLYPSNKNLIQDKKNTELIKNLLDSIKALQHYIKPLMCSVAEKDEVFYGSLAEQWELIDSITTPLYNKVRNYLTRKAHSTEKIKLNFDNAQLLDGWDRNKEKDNTCVLLRQGNNFYLGIINKKHKEIFEKPPVACSEDCYEKMMYKLLPGANKMLPKVFFSKSRIDEFAPSSEIVSNYDRESHKKGETFVLKDCHQLIDFFKQSIEKHEDWSKFGFQFSDTSSYSDLSGFYREVEEQGYKITFQNIDTSYIDELVSTGKLYLFQIYNKDFSEHSKGTPNLHTLYWRALFDQNNLDDVVYKLNGSAEVFYRKKSITWSDDVMKHGHHHAELKDKFPYPIIKDRRYTVDKFQFHVPIALNFKARGTKNINPQVHTFIRNGGVQHIIGIDRGERHLLYLTVIDLNGNIVEQQSLNTITTLTNGEEHIVSYHEKLKTKEAERDTARKSWQTIENIKELKEGYLSQVVHQIAKLIVKYKAIVVLEDLNSGFMRGRQKVERQVYQKFEKALIDKLNYLVDKQRPIEAEGGVLHAYQLTNPFESFQKLGKQSGFLFYVPAWNTSKIDPVTGFVNLLDTKYESMPKTKAFIEKFDFIRYNTEASYYELGVDYNNFTTRAEGTRTQWVITTRGERIRQYRNPTKNNTWEYETINLTELFDMLFATYHIEKLGDIKASLLACSETNKEMYLQFMQLLKLTLQMRNSNTEKDPNAALDYIISPVADANDRFYDSRNGLPHLPKDADANGAYNIARKGLWAIEQIMHSKEGDKINLAITNKEWLSFVQQDDK